MIPFILSSGMRKLIYSGRKQNSGCLNLSAEGGIYC